HLSCRPYARLLLLDPRQHSATITSGFILAHRGAIMADPLTCPNGHHIDLPLDDGTISATQVACPVCGAWCEVPGRAPGAPAPVGGRERATASLGPPPSLGTSRTELKVPAIPVPADIPFKGLPLVPGYELVEKLGQGGMGMVFKARQVKLNR